MGILGIGRRDAIKEKLRIRKSLIESRLTTLTAKLGTAKNAVVRARLTDRISMLTARLEKINGMLAQQG